MQEYFFSAQDHDVSLLSQLANKTKSQETAERIPEVTSAETLSPYPPSPLASTSKLIRKNNNANDFKCHISAGRRVAHLSVF